MKILRRPLLASSRVNGKHGRITETLFKHCVVIPVAEFRVRPRSTQLNKCFIARRAELIPRWGGGMGMGAARGKGRMVLRGEWEETDTCCREEDEEEKKAVPCERYDDEEKETERGETLYLGDKNNDETTRKWENLKNNDRKEKQETEYFMEKQKQYLIKKTSFQEVLKVLKYN